MGLLDFYPRGINNLVMDLPQGKPALGGRQRGKLFIALH